MSSGLPSRIHPYILTSLVFVYHVLGPPPSSSLRFLPIWHTTFCRFACHWPFHLRPYMYIHIFGLTLLLFAITPRLSFPRSSFPFSRLPFCDCLAQILSKVECNTKYSEHTCPVSAHLTVAVANNAERSLSMYR
ncbi:hypothetical protein FIBSPDRAFT_329332 [Athelia psychrophila]|uniref:Uncharacterized protein n=1 Tax=Athelia psychrophila TaxID=1759441 RepID=A0A167WKS0_9AGAM|nr:hypothetical protein FIBSPDRAFT_329332 [Fibularhizoctonia sp. CBS 109695]